MSGYGYATVGYGASPPDLYNATGGYGDNGGYGSGSDGGYSSSIPTSVPSYGALPSTQEYVYRSFARWLLSRDATSSTRGRTEADCVTWVNQHNNDDALALGHPPIWSWYNPGILTPLFYHQDPYHWRSNIFDYNTPSTSDTTPAAATTASCASLPLPLPRVEANEAGHDRANAKWHHFVSLLHVAVTLVHEPAVRAIVAAMHHHAYLTTVAATPVPAPPTSATFVPPVAAIITHHGIRLGQQLALPHWSPVRVIEHMRLHGDIIATDDIITELDATVAATAPPSLSSPEPSASSSPSSQPTLVHAYQQPVSPSIIDRRVRIINHLMHHGWSLRQSYDAHRHARDTYRPAMEGYVTGHFPEPPRGTPPELLPITILSQQQLMTREYLPVFRALVPARASAPSPSISPSSIDGDHKTSTTAQPKSLPMTTIAEANYYHSDELQSMLDGCQQSWLIQPLVIGGANPTATLSSSRFHSNFMRYRGHMDPIIMELVQCGGTLPPSYSSLVVGPSPTTVADNKLIAACGTRSYGDGTRELSDMTSLVANVSTLSVVDDATGRSPLAIIIDRWQDREGDYDDYHEWYINDRTDNAHVTTQVQLLCEAKADVNQVSFGGKTPLHRAVAKQAADVVRVLLKYGADANGGTATQSIMECAMCPAGGVQVNLGMIEDLCRAGTTISYNLWESQTYWNHSTSSRSYINEAIGMWVKYPSSRQSLQRILCDTTKICVLPVETLPSLCLLLLKHLPDMALHDPITNQLRACMTRANDATNKVKDCSNTNSNDNSHDNGSALDERVRIRLSDAPGALGRLVIDNKRDSTRRTRRWGHDGIWNAHTDIVIARNQLVHQLIMEHGCYWPDHIVQPVGITLYDDTLVTLRDAITARNTWRHYVRDQLTRVYHWPRVLTIIVMHMLFMPLDQPGIAMDDTSIVDASLLSDDDRKRQNLRLVWKFI